MDKKQMDRLEALNRKAAETQQELGKIEAERQALLKEREKEREKERALKRQEGVKALAAVTAKLDAAYAEAEKICDEYDVDFRYAIGDGSATYVPNEGWSSSS